MLCRFAPAPVRVSQRRVGRTGYAVVALLFVGCGSGRALSLAPLAPAVFADADSTALASIAPGVTHTFVRDRRGPWAIHVVEIDARRCAPRLEARKPGRDLHARATTSQLGAGALAAINADFFMLPRGTPVGAHVTGGTPLTGPTDRPIFAVTTAGWRSGVARMDGHARVHADSAAIAQVNRSAARTSAYRGTHDGLTLFTSWIGDTIGADSTARRVVLRYIDGNEARGRGIVVAADSPASAAPIQPGTAVLLAHGSARDWARRRSAGDTVAWNARVMLDAPVDEAVGGFPELLRDGRTVSGQTVPAAFAASRHPRTAIGWTPDRRLLLVVVDGRQPPFSEGMSLAELTWLFQRLGASDALNLDGGGSTALVLHGRLASRPSDREGERAVGNALVLADCP